MTPPSLRHEPADIDLPFLVRDLGELAMRDRRVLAARVIGTARGDGLLDGDIEFRADDGSVTVSPRETRQPNLTDLVYWSTGIGQIYLEGAFARSLASPMVAGRQIE